MNNAVSTTSKTQQNWKPDYARDKVLMRRTSFMEADIFYIIDITALALILLQVFILDYLGLSFVPRIAIFVMAFVRVFFSRRKYVVYYLLGIAIALLLILGSLTVGNLNYGALIRNLYYLLCPFGAVLYMAVIAIDRPGLLHWLSKKAFIPANIWIVVNYIVVYIQLNYHTLVAVNNTGYTEATNYTVFWWDAAAGLFIFCGTHVLCLYTVFVIIYDFWYMRRLSTMKGKLGLSLWIAILIIVSLYTATLNENKALFLLLPIYLLALAIPKLRLEKEANNIVGVIVGAAFVIIASVVLFSSDAVWKFLDENVISLVDKMSQNVFVGSDASGSYERVAMIGYAATNSETWAFGTGIGAHSLHGAGYLGFQHFGQSDLGTIPIICGIWFELLIMASYVVMFVQIAGFAAKRCLTNHVLSITIVLLVTMGFTRVVSSVPVAVSFAMVIWAFGLVWDSDKQS